MSRVLKIAFGLGAICAATIIYYAARPETFAHKPYDSRPKKGVVERPSNANSLAGHYYIGDGTGYNVYLTLNPGGTYSAEWQGCLGSYGEAVGDWNLADTQIVFVPSTETDQMRDHLKKLDILKFQGHWILLPVDKKSREFYDQFGISCLSCFQNTNSIFNF